MKAPDSLVNYVSEFNKKKDSDTKWEVCQKYRDKEWVIYIPLVAGEYINDYWTIKLSLERGGEIVIVVPLNIEGCGKNLLVKVPSSIDTINQLNCHLIAVEEYI